jgi:hypothetical protein
MLFVKQGIQNYLTYAGSFLKFKGFSFSTYNVNAKLITEAMIQDLKAKGKKVNLFTVNDPQEFDRFVNATDTDRKMLLVKKSMKNYLRVEICTQPGTGTTCCASAWLSQNIPEIKHRH